MQEEIFQPLTVSCSQAAPVHDGGTVFQYDQWRNDRC